MTARFVRTQKEMEGATRTWALVDEADDVRELTADDELTIVGKPAPRLDGGAGSRTCATGRRRAGRNAPRSRAPLTVAHGRVRSLDLEAALATPGAGGDRA
jgi:hypothetical protein